MGVLFVDQLQSRERLYPLVLTRPIADLRIGILTLSEKWAGYLEEKVTGHQTAEYLQQAFPFHGADEASWWIIDGILPTPDLLNTVLKLGPGKVLVQGGRQLVARGIQNPLKYPYERVEFQGEINFIERPWDLFHQNGEEIRSDYKLLTEGRSSEDITDPHTVRYGSDIFVEEGANIKAAVLNAENGPIYIGRNVEIQEGTLIRGPFAAGEGSIIKMGAKIRGDSTIGPYCKVGGEVSNSILWGYSSKAHDGFLGNAVIGQWCNIGADTNNSNLKNSYDAVSMWDYETQKHINTGRQFCGLMMGDHSKCAINTMFNTGTSVGVAANIFGAGFPPTFIPSFSWGGPAGFVTHHFRKAVSTAKLVMARRNRELSDADMAILNHVFKDTARFRVWETE